MADPKQDQTDNNTPSEPAPPTPQATGGVVQMAVQSAQFVGSAVVAGASAAWGWASRAVGLGAAPPQENPTSSASPTPAEATPPPVDTAPTLAEATPTAAPAAPQEQTVSVKERVQAIEERAEASQDQVTAPVTAPSQDRVSELRQRFESPKPDNVSAATPSEPAPEVTVAPQVLSSQEAQPEQVALVVQPDNRLQANESKNEAKEKDLATLGLPSDASATAIRKAYRAIALENHPDRLDSKLTEQQREAAIERFKVSEAAYKRLLDGMNTSPASTATASLTASNEAPSADAAAPADDAVVLYSPKPAAEQAPQEPAPQAETPKAPSQDELDQLDEGETAAQIEDRQNEERKKAEEQALKAEHMATISRINALAEPADSDPKMRASYHRAILGIAPDDDVTDAAIQKIHRKMALALHPDKHPNNREQAEAAFKRLAEANENRVNLTGKLRVSAQAAASQQSATAGSSATPPKTSQGAGPSAGASFSSRERSNTAPSASTGSGARAFVDEGTRKGVSSFAEEGTRKRASAFVEEGTSNRADATAASTSVSSAVQAATTLTSVAKVKPTPIPEAGPLKAPNPAPVAEEKPAVKAKKGKKSEAQDAQPETPSANKDKKGDNKNAMQDLLDDEMMKLFKMINGMFPKPLQSISNLAEFVASNTVGRGLKAAINAFRNRHKSNNDGPPADAQKNLDSLEKLVDARNKLSPAALEGEEGRNLLARTRQLAAEVGQQTQLTRSPQGPAPETHATPSAGMQAPTNENQESTAAPAPTAADADMDDDALANDSNEPDPVQVARDNLSDAQREYAEAKQELTDKQHGLHTSASVADVEAAMLKVRGASIDLSNAESKLERLVPGSVPVRGQSNILSAMAAATPAPTAAAPTPTAAAPTPAAPTSSATDAVTAARMAYKKADSAALLAAVTGVNFDASLAAMKRADDDLRNAKRAAQAEGEPGAVAPTPAAADEPEAGAVAPAPAAANAAGEGDLAPASVGFGPDTNDEGQLGDEQVALLAAESTPAARALDAPALGAPDDGVAVRGMESTSEGQALEAPQLEVPGETGPLALRAEVHSPAQDRKAEVVEPEVSNTSEHLNMPD